MARRFLISRPIYAADCATANCPTDTPIDALLGGCKNRVCRSERSYSRLSPRLAPDGARGVKIPRSTVGDDEVIMTKRRRFKQTTTLAYRLTEQAGRLRERARQLPPGTEQNSLWHKIHQTETALRIDALLSSSQGGASNGIGSLTGKSQRKRSARSVHGAAR